MLETLIINQFNPEREAFDTHRFNKMIQSLKLGGIRASYHALETTTELLQLIDQQQPQLVYCANYYLKDQSGQMVNVHRLLDEHGACRIGSKPEALEMVLSKSALKKKWVKDHVSTARFFELYRTNGQVVGLETAVKAADYPYILKPDREGNSRGLDSHSIVFDEKSLRQKAEGLLQNYDRIMVEKFLGKAENLREFTVGMIGSGKQTLLMPAEIRLNVKKRVRLVTTQDKDKHRTEALPVRNILLGRKLAAFAEKTLESAGMRDYARLDVMMANGTLYAIEINGLPMIPDKWFEICAKGVGLNSDQYLNAIFLSALQSARTENGRKDLKVPVQMKAILPKRAYDRLTREPADLT